MVGIRGTSVLMTLKVRVTNHVMPMAIALILQGVAEVVEVFKILVEETVAKAMATAVVLASILFNLNHLQMLCHQQQKCKNNTSLTVSAKIPNGDGMMHMILLTQVNNKTKGTSCSGTRNVFLVVNRIQQIIFVIFH
jgi:hypothetical protein